MDMGTWTGHVLWNLYHSWSCDVTMLGFGWAGEDRPLLGTAGTAANQADQLSAHVEKIFSGWSGSSQG